MKKALAAAIAAAAVATASPAFAGSNPVTGTLSLRPGLLSFSADGHTLTVIDATGLSNGWRVEIQGNVEITDYHCGAESTCALPSPGFVDNWHLSAVPGTGRGEIAFDWQVSGNVTVNLIAGP